MSHTSTTEEAAITSMDPNLLMEEQNRQIALHREELAQIEDEIVTLETVLTSKKKRSAELKNILGITPWKEFTNDINQGIINVKHSNILQKTSAIFGGISGNISGTLGQMRNSDSMRSFEEKVGSIYGNVKTKIVSRSNSQNFDDENRSRTGSIVTSPTIDEEKPFP